MPRWNWSWEETSRGESPRGVLEADPPSAQEPPAGAVPKAGNGKQPPPPARPTGSDGSRNGEDPRRRALFYRRRAAAAGLAAALVLALVIAAVVASEGGGARPGAHARAGRGHGVVAKTPAGAASEPTPQAEEAAINHVLSYTPAVVHGGRKGNEVALTFDDGPGPYTSRLVAALNSLHVRATFFAIGMMERWFSAGTRAELRSGDAVEDHSQTHPMMASLPGPAQTQQLLDQMAHIELLGGARPRLFRPPYGSYDPETFRELKALHLLMILWSTDTEDYKMPGVDAIVHSALAGAHPGAIILMHDGGGDRSQTIAALPRIIKGLKNRGLRPVTVPRLLLDDPPAPGQPIPSTLAE
jgi:peptidoglycan/xylan/chitin deacetylase (PgdA/CDA1 family)